MIITGIDKKTFELSENEQMLGRLSYKSVFSYHAQIDLVDVGQFELKPKGFFRMKMVILQRDREIGNLEMNWKGQITIKLHNEEYIFKSTSMMQTKYELANKNHERIAVLHQNFEWKKFRYSYEVFPETASVNPMLILLSVYAANYYVAAMSAVS